ncbi:MAG: hypothetical protein HY360_17485 [Verrucomicrobia bacterium]|nr:hypothetical protein [Verrucomicrobiota bacterium]
MRIALALIWWCLTLAGPRLAAEVIARWEMNAAEGADELADLSRVGTPANAFISDPARIVFRMMFNVTGLDFAPDNDKANNAGNQVICDNAAKLNGAFEKGLRIKVRLAFTGEGRGVLFAKNKKADDGRYPATFCAHLRSDADAKPNTFGFYVGAEGTAENATVLTGQPLETGRLYDVAFIYQPARRLEILVDGVRAGVTVKNVPKRLFAQEGPFYIGAHAGASPLCNVFFVSLTIATGEDE